MMKTLYTDAQLITFLASPDVRQVDKAVSQLYRQHKDMVIRLIRRNGGSEQDAQEVLDDALMAVWEAVRVSRYQPTARIKTYLYQISRFIWLKRCREHAREIVLYDTEFIDVQHPTKGVDELYEIREKVDAFWTKARTLGGKCYEVLRASAEGYTMQEIAIQHNLGTADNAKTTKYNCLRRIGKLTE